MSRYIDMTGVKINNLTFIKIVFVNKNRLAYWECACDCGKVKIISGSGVRQGKIKSCGCLAEKNLELGRDYFRGKKRPEQSGKNCHLWRGGISNDFLQIRGSLEYKKWRNDVFTRDSYTCKICNKKGGRLNADHIKSFRNFPELRFDINNGRTLCVDCHRKTDNYGQKAKQDIK